MKKWLEDNNTAIGAAGGILTLLTLIFGSINNVFQSGGWIGILAVGGILGLVMIGRFVWTLKVTNSDLKKELDDFRAKLKHCEEAHAEQASQVQIFDVNEIDHKILKHLGQNDGRPLSIENIENNIGTDRLMTRFELDRLVQGGYIDARQYRTDGSSAYSLTHDGRKYLVRSTGG